MEKLLKRCKEFNIQNISIGGLGEPLLHPGFFEFIDMISSFQISNITLTTNGLLFTEESQKKLVNSGISKISISVHGYQQETYNKIMGIDYDIVTNNILRFINNYKNQRNILWLSIVKNKINYKEAEDIIDFWNKKRN